MIDPIISEGTFELKFKAEKPFQVFGQQYLKCYANLAVKGSMSAPTPTGPLGYTVNFKLDCGCESVMGQFQKAYDKTFSGATTVQDRDWTGQVVLCKLVGTPAPAPARRGFRARIPSLQATNSTTTTLVSDLSGQPWLDGYALGKGVNAVTGVLSAQALNPFTVKQAQSQNSHTTYANIFSTSDVDQLINVSASGSYNMDGITVNASTSYLSQIKQSTLDLTILATYQVEYNDYDTINSSTVSFAPQAQQLIDAGQFDKFRALYGDYYLAGSRRQATFRAVYTVSANSSETLTQVKASLGASAPDMFTAQGEAEFKSAIANKNVSVSFFLDMQGMPTNAPNRPTAPIGMDTVQEYLQWFQQYNEPVPGHAEMIHYSQISAKIPTTLPIDPNIFSAVGDIYFNTYLLQITLNSLPSSWQGSYPTQVNSVVKKVMANAQTLVEDDATRTSLSGQVSALLNDLNNLSQRYLFIQTIQKLQSSEPAIGASQSESGKFGSTNYTNAANDPAFVIQYTSQNYEQGYKIGHRSHDFDIAVDGTIVQWELHQVWDDGSDGTWHKNNQNNNSDYILLNNSARIHCESEYDRGFNNTLSVWYVANSLIPGSVTVPAQEAVSQSEPVSA
ncbi:hypothetical protein [Hymenobacter cellulosivorans]|uniref:MACPF domain-containing protein n=1 Tax=Hymenobacter cellulosivorans TaxID=2932249 RepID=A0ABY4F261_9BACT|nr:hypothetical protein [Hymenobacter cellulosivorans]UOQ50755.1 hypothetical protein MUN80_13400 [Hymenobacter cellulosivorans]